MSKHMRKLKLQVQMSVDGFISGLNREMDWLTFDWDDELKKCVTEITTPIDLTRRTSILINLAHCSKVIEGV
jgi:hypothetical protein